MSEIRLAALTILLLLFWSAPCLGAAPEEAPGADNEYTRDGGYLGLGGIFALENANGIFDGTSDTGGISFLAGYRMIPALGFEVEGNWLHGFADNALGGRNVPLGSAVVNLKFYVAETFNRSLLGGRFQPYLIGSAGVIIADLGNKTPIDGQFGGGAGAEYYFTENWVLNGYVQYKDGTGALTGADFTSFMLGAMYRW